MKKAVTYRRVSTAEQADAGTSLGVQAGQTEAYAERQGWALVGVYEDAGLSGTSDARPGWGRLLTDAEAGAFDVVIVSRLDRFSRSLAHAAAAVDRLRKAGVDLVSVGDQIDLTTPTGELQFNVMLSFAQFEVSRIRERGASGQRARAAQGKVPGGAMPYGWRRSSDGGYEHDPAEAETIGMLAHHILAEDGTTGSAAALMNALGRPRRSGAPWTHQRVLSTLDSRASLLGELTWGKPRSRGNSDGEGRRRSTKVDAKGRPLYGAPVVVRLGDPIVEPETFERIHDVLRLRRYGKRRDSAPYPLSGMLLCLCGAPMGGVQNKGTRQYRCRDNRWRAQGDDALRCRHPRVNAEWAEREVWRAVSGELRSPRLVMKAASDWVRDQAGSGSGSVGRTGARADLADVEARIAALNRGLTRSLAAAVRAGASGEVIDAVAKGATSEIAVLERRAAKLRSALAQAPPEDDWAVAMAKGVVAISRALGKRPLVSSLREPLAALRVIAVPVEPAARPRLRVECAPDVVALLALARSVVGDSEEAVPRSPTSSPR